MGCSGFYRRGPGCVGASWGMHTGHGGSMDRNYQGKSTWGGPGWGGSSRWGARGQRGLEKCSSWALRSALRVCGERLGIYRGSSSSRGAGVARCTPEAFPPGALGLRWGNHCWLLMPSSQPGSLDPNILSSDPAPRRTMCRGGRWGQTRGAPPYMYSETGALEMV